MPNTEGTLMYEVTATSTSSDTYWTTLSTSTTVYNDPVTWHRYTIVNVEPTWDNTWYGWNGKHGTVTVKAREFANEED